MLRLAWWEDDRETAAFLAEPIHNLNAEKQAGCRRGIELAERYPPVGKAAGGMYVTQNSGRVIICRTWTHANRVSLPMGECVMVPDELPEDDTFITEDEWPEWFRESVSEEAVPA